MWPKKDCRFPKQKAVANPARSCFNPGMTLPARRSERVPLLLLLVAGLIQLLPVHSFAGSDSNVALVLSDATPPVRHGTARLKLALDRGGVHLEEVASLPAATNAVVVVAGLAAGAGEAARLMADLKLPPPKGTPSTISASSFFSNQVLKR